MLQNIIMLGHYVVFNYRTDLLQTDVTHMLYSLQLSRNKVLLQSVLKIRERNPGFSLL